MSHYLALDGAQNRANSLKLLQNLQPVVLQDGPEIMLFTRPYFIATKFSAFHGRGNGNHRTSHDFEDIIYLTDNANRGAD